MAEGTQFLTIRVLGDEEAATAFRKRGRDWLRVRQQLATESSYIVARELKLAYSEGPLFARSNLLERSVGVFTKTGAQGMESGAGTKVFYAQVHEEGAVIHGNPLMHWQEDGKWVHARMVTIPARKPGQRAYENAEPKVRKLWHIAAKGVVF